MELVCFLPYIHVFAAKLFLDSCCWVYLLPNLDFEEVEAVEAWVTVPVMSISVNVKEKVLQHL